MRALTKANMLAAALTGLSMMALAWIFRDRLADPRYVALVFASPVVLFSVFGMVILRSVRSAPAELAHLDEPLSDQAGYRIFNVAMGILLFIVCFIILMLMIVAFRSHALAVIQSAILTTGVVAAWYYRRRFQSPTIAPYAVSMIFTASLMGLILLSFDWGVIASR